MANVNQGGLLNLGSVNIPRTSNIMIVLVLIGLALSLVGFTPIGGVFFLGSFVCALVIVFEAMRSWLLR